MEMTYQQEQVARNYAIARGLDEEEVLSATKELGERFGQIMEEVKRTIRRFVEWYRPFIQAYKRYWHQQNVKFFKKKKSQRKNWSKWKKRNR